MNAFLITTLTLSIAATPPAYHIEDLGTLGGELANSLGINEYGDVCGQAENSNFGTEPFLWTEAGGMIGLGSFSVHTGGRADAVNDLGYVVGNSMDFIDPGYAVKPFIWHETTGMLDLGIPPYGLARDINNVNQVCGEASGGTSFVWDAVNGPVFFQLWAGGGTTATAINNNGIVAGYAWDFDNELKAFRYDIATGQITILPGLAVSDSVWGINDHDIVVGSSARPNWVRDAVYWTAAGELVALPLLSEPHWLVHGEAERINENNWIVGKDWAAEPGYRSVAWLYIDGEKWALNDLITDYGTDVWEITFAADINNAGQIVGIALKNGTPGVAFRMTPVDLCPADVVENGEVDTDDFLAVLAGWGGCAEPCPPRCDADIVPNCNVDADDFLAVLAQWGPCLQPALGPCCLPVGDCAVMSELDCNLAEGEWDGSRSDCTGVTCPGRPDGDLIENALDVPGLPYSTTGNLAGMTDDYDTWCPWPSSVGPDVVYAFTPVSDMSVEVSMCTNTSFDSKLYVFENFDGNVVACNGDYCITPLFPDYALVSLIPQVDMTAGNTYYIVVDSDNGDAGPYTLDIVEVVTAACCLGDGSCDMLTEELCADALGEWHFGDTCATYACPPDPLGACCAWPFGECVDLTQADCDALSLHDWQGVGTSCATVTCPVAPPGDVMETAWVLSSLPYSGDGDTSAGYRNDYDVICPFENSIAPDVVYTHTPTTQVAVSISLCRDSAYDTKLYVYDATDDVVVGCNDDACSSPSIATYVSAIEFVELLAGHEYFIFVDGYGTGAGYYTIDVDVIPYGACCMTDTTCQDIVESDCIVAGGDWQGPDTVCASANCLPPVIGDTIEDPFIVASLPFSTTGDTTGFVHNYDVACGLPSTAPDVVYAYTPAQDETISISLCGNTAYDSKLFVFENSEANPIACNDDFCTTPSFPSDAWVSHIDLLDVTVGSTYFIVIDGHLPGDAGTYTLDITNPAAGACCHPDGNCYDASEEWCQVQAGFWDGNETCATVSCPPLPRGACCRPGGGCIDNETEWRCINNWNGTWQGAGSNCGTAGCP